MKHRVLAGTVIGAVLGAHMGPIVEMVLWLFVWGDNMPTGALEITSMLSDFPMSLLLSALFALCGEKVGQRFVR